MFRLNSLYNSQSKQDIPVSTFTVLTIVQRLPAWLTETSQEKENCIPCLQWSKVTCRYLNVKLLLLFFWQVVRKQCHLFTFCLKSHPINIAAFAQRHKSAGFDKMFMKWLCLSELFTGLSTAEVERDEQIFCLATNSLCDPVRAVVDA